MRTDGPARDGDLLSIHQIVAGRIVDAGSATFMLVGCTTLNVIIILGVLARFPLVAFTIISRFGWMDTSIIWGTFTSTGRQ